MKKVIRYNLKRNRNGNTLKDALNNFEHFDMEISCKSNTDFASCGLNPSLLEKHCPLDYPALLERLKKSKPAPRLVHICGFCSVKEVSEILSIIKDSVEGLYLFKCPDLEDLSFLEELPRLKTLNMYWNRKATKLFDSSKMANLQKFILEDCNKVIDFSGLKNSNIEYLGLFGCNGAASFTSKLDVGDMEFLEYMPKLNHLRLDIMRTRPDELYLKTIAKVKTLERFFISSSFFTFEQFAWLSAHLPNVKEDLEPCTYYISQTKRGTKIVPDVEEYFVIGRHKTYVKTQKAIKYLNAFNELREQFRNIPEPPPTSFTVKI